MTALIKSICTIILSSTISDGFAQEKYSPTKINTTEEYIHPAGLKFPVAIKEFSRQNITSFDSTNSNISIAYMSKTSEGITKFSVYIYSDKNATENRLRTAYLLSLKSMSYSTKSTVQPDQHLFSFESNGYKINCFRAEINDTAKPEYNYLSVLECGKWMMKFRMTSNFQATKELHELQQELLQLFNPVELVKKYPVNPGVSNAELVFLNKAIKDKVLIQSIMLAGVTKIGWVTNHVDSLERVSGFPGVYLEEHTGPLKVMVTVWKKMKEARKESTDDFMIELSSIINSGFLDEFVMDQYNMLLFTPAAVKFDFEKYKNWRLKNRVTINLHEPYYVIRYID